MNEIKCPHCGTVFSVDEAEYASLVQQVRTAEFEQELHVRLAEAHKAKQALRKQFEGAGKAQELALAQAAEQAQKALGDRQAMIERLKAELDGKETARDLAVAKVGEEAQKAAAQKDAQILRLKAELSGAEAAEQLAEVVQQSQTAASEKDTEIPPDFNEAADRAMAMMVADRDEEVEEDTPGGAIGEPIVLPDGIPVFDKYFH